MLLTRGAPAAREARSSLENPGIPLNSPQAWALIAGQISTDSGINLSEFTALRSAAVWRCVHLLSGTVAQMPLRVWQGKRGEVERTAIDVPWSDNPNPEVPWFEFMETSMAHELLWGNAFWLPVKNGLGQTIQLWSLPPWSTFVTRDPSTVRGVPGAKVYRINVAEGLILHDGDVVHIPGLGYDGIRGLSPVAHLRQALGLGIAAEQYGARLFGSGSLMSGILTSDKKMTEAQADTAKARWRQKMTGLQKSHEVAILDDGLKWSPVGIPPEDAQFLQTRQFAVAEIARMYGVPPHLLFETEKDTTWGTGIAEQSLAFVRYTLSQWLARFEGRVTRWLCPPNTYAEFDTSKMLRGDNASRFASYAAAIPSGWITRNEVRALEMMQPSDAPGMDDFVLPVAGTPVAMPPGKDTPDV